MTHDWIASDGCDSLYSAAADNSAVYVAGVPAWLAALTGPKLRDHPAW